MEFKKNQPLPLLVCDVCNGVGRRGFKKCAQCRGMAAGLSLRGSWLYWGFPLDTYNLRLQAGRRMLNIIRFITVLVLWLNAWIWAALFVYKQGVFTVLKNPKQWAAFVASLDKWSVFLFWFGVVALLYLWYRVLRQKEPFDKTVGLFNFYNNSSKEHDLTIDSWPEAVRVSRKNKKNIAIGFTPEALAALGKAYLYANKVRSPAMESAHIFYALLSCNRISNIFIRLGIPSSVLLKEAEALCVNSAPIHAGVSPRLSNDVLQIIFQSYENAFAAKQPYVSVTELLMFAISANSAIQNILFNYDISERQLANVVAWARMKEKMHRDYLVFKKAVKHHSKYGMDRAMTALATPYLNSFSTDVTVLAHYGQLEPCVARGNELDEVFQMVEAGEKGILLVGETGVGKNSIIEDVAQRMVAGEVPDLLKDKRLVRLGISSLLAGASPEGVAERVQRIMQETARARNVVLYISGIDELIGITIGQEGGLDMADTLREFLSDKNIIVFATTTPERYAQHVLGSSLKSMFTMVEIGEMNEDQAIQVLESRAGFLEYKHSVFFSYAAIEKCVEFAKKFFHDTPLPVSALELLTESASYTKNKKGSHAIITKEEVALVVTAKTKIPVASISGNESEKLMRLEEEMHKRVVGQEEAVQAVAGALRRARADLHARKRPMASFLFLGPTGVGKTELAKTIADIYFGGENRMIRLDMSEYQDKTSLYRLIGMPGSQGTGILTEAVHKAPFSLVLLDEIEKADPDILNLFLQVMDDGRLTDSAGRVFDFTNVIIIATSNAGTLFVREQARIGVSHDELLSQLLHEELHHYFRPEFLNRFDGIVLFNSLERDAIKQVARLMFDSIAKDMENKGVHISATEEALDFLADAGFDPEFGARPMRRALQEKVENKMAELFLQGKLKRGSNVTIGAQGALFID